MATATAFNTEDTNAELRSHGRHEAPEQNQNTTRLARTGTDDTEIGCRLSALLLTATPFNTEDAESTEENCGKTKTLPGLRSDKTKHYADCGRAGMIKNRLSASSFAIGSHRQG